MRGSSKGPRPRGDHLDDGAFCMIDGPKGYDVPGTRMRVMQMCGVIVRSGERGHMKGGFSGRRSRRAQTPSSCIDEAFFHERCVPVGVHTAPEWGNHPSQKEPPVPMLAG